MQMLWLDLEAKSEVDLQKSGLMHYAQDPSTELICMSYSFGDERYALTWFPEDGDVFPPEVEAHIQAGGLITAHNAAFERHMFDYVMANDYDIKPPALEQWRCSQARAMASGLPANLKDLGLALQLKVQKQREGTRLIREYCMNGGQPWKAGDKQLMQKYCEADVLTMREACSRMRDLSDEEWAEYHHNEEVNDIGVPVDVDFARAALGYVEQIKAEVNVKIQELTRGFIESATARKNRDIWLTARLTNEQLKIITVVKKGVSKISFDKQHREDLLLCGDLPENVRQFVELVEEAGGSATSKYKAVVDTSVDGRLHGMMVWHGAGTSRYSSKGFQIHNIIRDAIDDPQPLIDEVKAGVPLVQPSATLARLLRATVTASDGITYGDWSAIEGRVCPWLADDPRAERVLDIFRNDEDLYTATASGMGLDDRQAGKIASLSLQFAGGAKALIGMAKNYGVVYTEEEAENYKNLWRGSNRWCVAFWKKLLNAAETAVRYPQTMVEAGKIKFFYDGGEWLWMIRPSGGIQGYFQPKFEKVTFPWGDTGVALTALAGSVKPAAGAPWPRRNLTAGILIENATQGTAADLLRRSLEICHTEGLPYLFSVHDEIVLEGEWVGELKEVMESVPDWAEGLPLKASCKFNERYGK